MSKTKAAPQQQEQVVSTEEREQKIELAAELATVLQDRLYSKLSKLDLPDEVWKLIHCSDFFNYYQRNPGPLETKDFPLFVEDALNALVKTGGL